MNNKQFKKIIKESISNGADMFFEEEEIPASIASDGSEDQNQDQNQENDFVQKLIESLSKASDEIKKLKQSGEFTAEGFAKALALYYAALYHEDDENWKASSSNDNVFNQSLNTYLMGETNKKVSNIICFYVKMLDWDLGHPMYKNPDVFAKSLRTKADNVNMTDISGRVSVIVDRGIKLSGHNKRLINKLLEKLKGVKMSDCTSGGVETPDIPDETPGEDKAGSGAGVVPIFKDLRTKDPETGKMKRVGAKEGGRSLQAVLQNWINKNGNDFDRKVLQKAIRQIVMDISKQMKANKIEIQEASTALSKRLNSLIERSNPDMEFNAEFEEEPLDEPSRRIGDEDEFIEDDDVDRLDTYLSSNKNAYVALKDYVKEHAEFEESDAIDLGLDAYGKLDEKLGNRRKQIVNLLKQRNFSEAAKLGLIAIKKAENQLRKIKTSHQKENGQKQTAENLSNHAMSYIKLYDLGNKVVDMYLEGPAEEEPSEDNDGDEKYLENEIFNKFKEILKRLDLHTSEGREAAKQNEQAYLGAFKFYKAMQAARKSIEKKTIDPDTANLLNKVEPLNERFGEDEHAAGEEFIIWLANMINIFKEAGLADSNRAVKAMRSARGAKEPQEKERVIDPNASSGTINTRQIIAPRLKAAGISLDKNSPQGLKGRKFVKNIQKVIRRFVARHLKKLGKDNIEQITENLEKRLILETLRSDIDFSNKDLVYESINNLVLRNLKKEIDESNQ
tara:strand:+ start:4633 stop:6828 length:2196 start_codon:yes stop_codon:yes gene_type:complete